MNRPRLLNQKAQLQGLFNHGKIHLTDDKIIR